MESFEVTYKELLKRFDIFKNGEVIEQLKKFGVVKGPGYGLSHQQIAMIAKDYQPENNLAIQLFRKKLRESKLLSFHLLVTENIEKDHLDEILQGLNSLELIEQASALFLYKLPEAEELAIKLCHSALEFERMTGFTLLARLSMTEKKPLKQQALIFELLKKEIFNATAMNRRSLSLTLRKVFNSRGEYYSSIAKLIEGCRQHGNIHSRWIAEEASLTFE